MMRSVAAGIAIPAPRPKSRRPTPVGTYELPSMNPAWAATPAAARSVPVATVTRPPSVAFMWAPAPVPSSIPNAAGTEREAGSERRVAEDELEVLHLQEDGSRHGEEQHGEGDAAQNELAALSTNSVHESLPNASHSMLTENKDTAARSSRAINERRQRSTHQDSPHRTGGLKMNNNTCKYAIAAGIAVTMMLSACGSTTTADHGNAVDGHDVHAVHDRERRRSAAPSLLPEPTGDFAVGVRTVPSVSPAATTRVWYPARAGTGTGPAIYLAAKAAAAYGLPDKPLRGVVTAGIRERRAGPDREARPAVVLMPGWGNPMALSTALAQDLASNGYVVVSVDPTPGSEDRIAPAGRHGAPGRSVSTRSPPRSTS